MHGVNGVNLLNKPIYEDRDSIFTRISQISTSLRPLLRNGKNLPLTLISNIRQGWRQITEGGMKRNDLETLLLLVGESFSYGEHATVSLALPDLTTEEGVATVHDEFCLECRQGRKAGRGSKFAAGTRLEREQEAS